MCKNQFRNHRNQPGASAQGWSGHMSATPCRFVIHAFVTATVVLACDAASAQPKRVTIEQFSADPNKFLNQEIQVEGRVLTSGGRFLRLRECDVSFEAVDDRTDLPIRMDNAAAIGTLRKKPRGLVFDMTSWRETDNDSTQFQTRERAIAPGKIEPWYKLAEWAISRGAFYKDANLRELGEGAVQRGIELEWNALSVENLSGRLELAAKAEQRKGSPKLSESLRFEVQCLKWLNLQRKFNVTAERTSIPDTSDSAATTRLVDEMDSLTTSIAEQSEAAKRRLDSIPGEPFDRSLATSPGRLMLRDTPGERAARWRALYTDVGLRAELHRLEPNWSNGWSVSAAVSERFPEYAALAKTLDQETLKRRIEASDRMSRRDVLAFVDELKQRKDEANATMVLTTHLRQRLDRLDPEDADAALALAADYRLLLKNPDQANALLIATAKRHPDSQEVVAELQRLGYGLAGDEWLTESQMRERAGGGLLRALKSGRVVPGMTVQMVRQSLGPPGKSARFVTRGMVFEYWSYPQADGTQLSVQFRRRRGEEQLLVMTVSQVTPLAPAAPTTEAPDADANRNP
jgi:hypothetical protein